MVPKAIAKTGKVTVGMDATFPPMGFVSDNGKSIIGAEADLAKALGQVIGLKLTIKQQPFAAILPRVERNDYALGLSAITDTKEREQQVNMVTYFSAGTSFYTAAKGGTQISGIDGICGVSVAVVNGTLPAADVRAQDAKCRELGRSPVKIVPLKEQAEHIQAVESGKVEVGLFDSPVVAYIVSKSEGKLIHTGEPYGEAPYGIAVSKSSNMTPVVLAAMKSLVANGQYAAILKEWGLSDGAISEPKVNDGS
ncbi:MAG: ABC transporter substrate-binding protein [Thermoleophilaceae bacterium]|nr:ABC transporter substrate-binding protein [Thermoleophilaceae bacterium]